MLKLSRKLFKDNPQEAEAFLAALQSPIEKKGAIIFGKDTLPGLPAEQGYPWHPDWILPIQEGFEAGKHPLHEEGAFYILDMSSVFAASILQEVTCNTECVLDLCAAPGGKALFAWRLFSPDLLIANEVIHKRAPALISNIKRCGIGTTLVTSRDPSFFAQRLEGMVPLVIVDAPCSGQSLVVKGKKNSGCFHPATINMNANRQKRILAASSATVSAGGYLAYMTCTYAPEENEKVIQWFLKKFPDFEPVSSRNLSMFQSLLTDVPCYRLFPQQKIGAGAFTALFRRAGVLSFVATDIVEGSITPIYRFDRKF